MDRIEFIKRLSMGIVAVAITPLISEVAQSLTVPNDSLNPFITESKKRLVQIRLQYFMYNGESRDFTQVKRVESTLEFELSDEQWAQLEKDFQQT